VSTDAPFEHLGALIVPVFFVSDRKRRLKFTLQHRMISMFVFRQSVDAGGLISYGPSLTGMYRRRSDCARGQAGRHAEGEIERAFTDVIQLKANALIVATDALLLGQRNQIVRLAARHSAKKENSKAKFSEVIWPRKIYLAKLPELTAKIMAVHDLS
jgi:hypothetical protein